MPLPSASSPARCVGPYADVENWGSELDRDAAIIVCQRGLKLSHGVAAWLRHLGLDASSLEGGFEAWEKAEYPQVRA